MYTEQTFKAELNQIWQTIVSFKPHWYRLGSKQIEIDDAWEMYRNARDANLSELLLGDVKLRSQLEVLKNFGTTSGTDSTMEKGALFTDVVARDRLGKVRKDGRGKVIYETIDTAQVQELVTGKAFNADAGIAHIRKGSVLNDGWWWPFKNDCWVLGGIHGLKRFHLTMPSAPDDLIWDAGAGRPRVLGRELLGLDAFGYALIGVPAWSKPVPAPKATGSSTSGAKPAVLAQTPVSGANIRATIGNVFAPQTKTDAHGATFTAYYAHLAKATDMNFIKSGILNKEVSFDTYDFSKI